MSASRHHVVRSVPRQIAAIQAMVAAKFDLTVEELLLRTNRPRIAWPRQIAMYLSARLTKFSLDDISNAFGFGNGGNARYAVKTVADEMSMSQELSAKIGEYLVEGAEMVKASKPEGVPQP